MLGDSMPLQLLKTRAGYRIALAPPEVHICSFWRSCRRQARAKDFAHRCQSFSGSPTLCTQCEGGFVIHGVKSYYLLIGQWWEASLQGLQAVLGIPEVLDEPFACGIGLCTGVASLVNSIKPDQASVPVCTTRMSR